MKKKVFMFLLTTISLISADFTTLKTINTEFVQKIKNSSNNTLTYEGVMFAKRDGNKAVWIYNSPVYKEIYYSAGKVVIIEPDLEQATFAKLKKIPNIITLLKKAKKISKNKYITKFANTTYTIKIDKNKIKEISYTDEMQNKVKITFKNEKLNQPIQNNRFIYQIPAGYDILKQ